MKGVGVLRDKELKLEDAEASHTLGGAGEGVPKETEVKRRRSVFGGPKQRWSSTKFSQVLEDNFLLFLT